MFARIKNELVSSDGWTLASIKHRASHNTVGVRSTDVQEHSTHGKGQMPLPGQIKEDDDDETASFTQMAQAGLAPWLAMSLR